MEKDRFFLTLFIKDKKEQEAIQRLDRFYEELARLKDVIETPMMGLIRLQWWRDEVAKIYQKKDVAPHAVLQDMMRIITDYHLPHDIVLSMIDAREADFIDHETFDIYAYAHQTHVPLMKMKAIILDVETDMTPLGQAYALIGLIRAIPYFREQLSMNIPAISPDAVKEICHEAERLLTLDENTHRYFKAHKALTRLYSQQIQKNGFSPENLRPLPFKELRVWWGSF